MLLRASTQDDLVLSSEVAELAQAAQGPRLQPCGLPLGGPARKGGRARPGPEEARRLCCWCVDFVAYMVGAVARLGVPRDAIHSDEYALG